MPHIVVQLPLNVTRTHLPTLAAVHVLVAVAALVELWHYGASAAAPSTPSEGLMLLGALAWLASPLLTLTLLARSGSPRIGKGRGVLAAALLCTMVALWLVISARRVAIGLEPLVVPAIQWLVVLAVLFGVRRVRDGALDDPHA